MSIAAGLFMAIALAGALLAVGLKNVLHAVFGLAVSLLGIAGLFLVLGSPFVAAMEVLIYVGGISIAMIFVVMLSAVVGMKVGETGGRRLLAAAAAALFFASVAVVVSGTEFATAGERSADAWSVKALGVNLLDRYNVVFEALSLILLLAIIGAVAIARRESDSGPAEEGGSQP